MSSMCSGTKVTATNVREFVKSFMAYRYPAGAPAAWTGRVDRLVSLATMVQNLLQGCTEELKAKIQGDWAVLSDVDLQYRLEDWRASYLRRKGAEKVYTTADAQYWYELAGQVGRNVSDVIMSYGMELGKGRGREGVEENLVDGLGKMAQTLEVYFDNANKRWEIPLAPIHIEHVETPVPLDITGAKILIAGPRDRIGAWAPPQASGGPKRVDGMWHPHVHYSYGVICLGEGDAGVKGLLARGMVLEAVDMITAVMNTYNPGSPYIKLGALVGWGTCNDCGQRPAAGVRCRSCGRGICGNCSTRMCRYCSNEYYCSDCLSKDREGRWVCQFCHESRFKGQTFTPFRVQREQAVETAAGNGTTEVPAQLGGSGGTAPADTPAVTAERTCHYCHHTEEQGRLHVCEDCESDEVVRYVCDNCGFVCPDCSTWCCPDHFGGDSGDEGRCDHCIREDPDDEPEETPDDEPETGTTDRCVVCEGEVAEGEGHHCHVCGDMTCSEHSYQCASCGEWVCGEHSKTCNRCMQYVCTECAQVMLGQFYCSEGCVVNTRLSLRWTTGSAPAISYAEYLRQIADTAVTATATGRIRPRRSEDGTVGQVPTGAGVVRLAGAELEREMAEVRRMMEAENGTGFGGGEVVEFGIPGPSARMPSLRETLERAANPASGQRGWGNMGTEFTHNSVTGTGGRHYEWRWRQSWVQQIGGVECYKIQCRPLTVEGVEGGGAEFWMVGRDYAQMTAGAFEEKVVLAMEDMGAYVQWFEAECQAAREGRPLEYERVEGDGDGT